MKTYLYIANIKMLEVDKFYDKAYDCASIQRKEKTDRLINLKDKQRSLLSELVLGYALKEKGIQYKEIKYGYEPIGKPYLIDHENIHFSISHSDDYVIVAIGDEQVGCDIEKIRKYDLKIAQRFFTENEYHRLLSMNDEEERRKKFFKYWTLKESFIKYTGEGLHRSLTSFDVEDKEYKDKLKNIEIIEGYMIGVCCENEIKIKALDQKEISSLFDSSNIMQKYLT